MSYKRKVYDLTPFLADHPGGDDLLMRFAGQDLGNVMQDPTEHVHSNAAYEMLDDLKIGELGANESTVSDDWVADENFHPDETNVSSDYERNQFLDLSKPLLRQVWYATWSKEYYLSQVHSPRHLKESARLFTWDILEALTRTKWYVVPLVWGPITLFLGYLSLLQFTDSRIVAGDLLQWPTQFNLLPTITAAACGKFLVCYALGCLIWTILEYTLHRFLFHIDFYLPDQNWALLLHFLLHGIHHYLPMDRLRLVMPPTLFLILETPFTNLAHLIFPKAVANGIIAGAFTFYMLYDCMHYALHHTRLPQYLNEQKRYHLAHHYKSESALRGESSSLTTDFELGFGVTSKFWDIIFNTLLPLTEK